MAHAPDDRPEPSHDALTSDDRPSSSPPGQREAPALGEDSRKGTFGRDCRKQSDSHHALKPGETLDDRYRILCLVGEGATGVVYKAESVLPSERTYAVKVLRAPASGGSYDLAIREARNTTLLRHRNIVSVEYVGATTDNRPFLVMEYIGKDLEEYVKERGGSLTPHEAIEFCAQVCDALDAAHHGRIAHRDVKPRNCLIRSEDGRAVVVVCDFGVARVLHREESRTNEWSKGDGTSGYTAPESDCGHPLPDHRVDIYSVGAMLARLLTGSPPLVGLFSAETTTIDEYLKAVPPALIDILRRALAVDPGQRLGSAKALGTELRLAMSSGTQAKGPSPSRPARRSLARALFVTACLVAVAIIASIAGHLADRKRAPVPQAALAGPTANICLGRDHGGDTCYAKCGDDRWYVVGHATAVPWGQCKLKGEEVCGDKENRRGSCWGTL